MSNSWSGRFDDIKARMKEAVGDSDGEIDLDTVMARVRENVARAGSDLDAETIVARAKDAVGAVEGKVNAGTIRQWIDDVDRDKVQGWVDEARTASAGAASFLGTQGERLAERAPGAIDKVVGVAKEAFGDFARNEDLARQGELQHLKGDIEARFADAADRVDNEGAAAGDAMTSGRKDSAD